MLNKKPVSHYTHGTMSGLLYAGLAFVSGAFNPVLAADLGPINVSGFIGTETRIFTQDHKHAGQSDNPEASIVFNPEFRYKTDDRRHQFSFIPFYREDSRDGERDHFDVREAYWRYRGDEWSILAGVNKVFWGVAESRHLVNIINQVDGVEDIDGEDYLGQAMLNIGTQRDWGKLDLFILPNFRERTYPGVNGRLRGALVVDDNDAVYQSGSGDKHVDFAARYSHYIGDWDVGLSYFHGTDREAVFALKEDGSGLYPMYNQINQVGLDLQYTTDAWLWKVETIGREGQGDSFAAAVGGFEYTLYQIFDSNMDLGMLAEYQYDGRDDKAPVTTQDEDIFAGLRLAFNDIEDTEILAGVSVDQTTHEQFYNIEAERRIGSHYDIELRARFFRGSDSTEPSFATQNDDYIQVRLSRHF